MFREKNDCLCHCVQTGRAPGDPQPRNAASASSRAPNRGGSRAGTAGRAAPPSGGIRPFTPERSAQFADERGAQQFADTL
jgi:hypothetical protein